MIEVKCKYRPLSFSAPTYKEAIQMAIGTLGEETEIQWMLIKKNCFGFIEILVIPK